MSEFLEQFFGFLIFSPLTAAVFGVGIWILPAVFLRDLLTRMRLRFFHFFVTGYAFIAIMAVYLLVIGSKVKAEDGGGRHHQAGPIVGMLVSLALAWWIQHLLRRRFPPPPPGGPPQPTYPGVGRTGYGHPGYGPVPPGYPQHPGYPLPGPQPGQPIPPGQPPHPVPPAQPPGQVTSRDSPHAQGVPWAVPPPGPTALPPTPPQD